MRPSLGTDADTKALLDLELEALLSMPAADAGERLLPVVPTALLERYSEACSYTIKIGHARGSVEASLELEDILRRTRLQRDGERVKALRGGWVSLNADSTGSKVLDDAHADKWLEANVSLGSARFFLMDGEWFEIGADYVRTSREAIERLFPIPPAIALPAWLASVWPTEFDYNCHVADSSLGRYLCLDTNKKVRDPLGARSALEICDLLGPG
jgi:uncharacterized protein (TIGR04141 family)